jgi:hypothetical protein
VLVKGSNFLEALNKVETVVFDKTGTLTKGVFHVVDIIPREGVSREQVLEYAARAEYFSIHPIAVSILEAYGRSKPVSLSGYREIPGQGVVAESAGCRILVGNPKLMETESVPFKFMTVLERYIIPDMGTETSIESHLYYVKPEDFTCRTLLQLKAKVKFNRSIIKKNIFGRKEQIFKTEVMNLQDFVKMSPDDKERAGIFIQELIISKIGLMGFIV